MRRAAGGEAQVDTLQNDLKCLRDFYEAHEGVLVCKTRETRNLELEEHHRFDLRREAMDALTKKHDEHVQPGTACR